MAKDIVSTKGGTTNLKVGGGVVQCIGGWGINTVKTLTFGKGGGAFNYIPPFMF